MTSTLSYVRIAQPTLIRYVYMVVALSALACAAGCADKAALLIYQRLIATIRATDTTGLSPIGQVFLERALNAHFPGIDALAIQFETADKFEHLVYRHSITKYT